MNNKAMISPVGCVVALQGGEWSDGAHPQEDAV